MNATNTNNKSNNIKSMIMGKEFFFKKKKSYRF